MAGGDVSAPVLQQRRLRLYGARLDTEDVQIAIPELQGLVYQFHPDHKWFETPVVTKSLIRHVPDSEPPSFIGQSSKDGFLTMELTYEFASRTLMYRILPYLDIEALHLAYLGDSMWICQNNKESRPIDSVVEAEF